MSEKFGKGLHFEERLVQCLMVDTTFAEQMSEVLDVEYFSLDVLKEVTNTLFDYYKKYRAFPSVKLLITIINSECKDDVIKEQCFAFFEKIKKNPFNNDLEYIKEESLEFCKKRNLLNTLSKCIDYVADKKYESIVYDVQKAISAGSEKNIGHDLVEGFEERMKEDNSIHIPTPWKEINDITNGGLSEGKIGVIMASSGVGKSHSMVDIAVHDAKLGYTVLIVSAELDAFNVGKRCDANLSDVPFDDLLKNKDTIKQKLQELKGKILIKYYPTKTATVLTIKNYIQKLKMNDIVPDVLIIDYADLLKSSRAMDSKRLDEELVYEELRGLAGELRIPIWTCTQANRGGADKEVLQLSDVAESYSKAMVADLFITMTRRKENNTNDLGNFYVAKNRLGVDGRKFAIMVNTGLSKIQIATPEMEIELLEQKLQDEEDSKDKLKRRLRETMKLDYDKEREEYNQ